MFEGIFSGSSHETGESTYVIKMARQTKSASRRQANGVSDAAADYVGTGSEHLMSFEMKDVVDLAVGGVTFTDTPNKSQNGMRVSACHDQQLTHDIRRVFWLQD